MLSSAVRHVRCCTTCGAVYRAEYPRCVNDGAELVMMSRDPLLGATVGPYVVDALLGEGGMGRVYRVHHARLPQKRYALKVLLGDFAATPPMRMRFAKEAQSASRLSHPNVVAVCDFGVTEAGLAYLAMDLVEGTPLSHLLTSEPIAPRRAIHLARQLCLGLAHAHDLGLIHRDFKPDNIIVVNEPGSEVPRIADFGLAISTDHSDIRLTTGGLVLGTPAYVAPEQCTGGDVDHRADLYALGVTVFEMLSGGYLPFDGDPAEVVGLKATADPPTILEIAPDVEVSLALAAIVDRLIARDPDGRYPDARAVIEALDHAVLFPDELPPPPRPAERPRTGDPEPRRPRRHGSRGEADAQPHRRQASHADGIEPSRRASSPADLAEPPPRRAGSDGGDASAGGAELEQAPTPPMPMPLSFMGPAARRLVTGVRTDRVRALQASRRAVTLLAGAIVLAALIIGGAVILTRSTDPAIAEPPVASEPAAVEPAAPAAAAHAPVAPAPEAAEPPASRQSDRAPPPKRTAKVAAPEPAPRTSPRKTAPPPPAAPAPPPPVVHEPRLATLDVRGALSNMTVRRAVDRVQSSTRACRSDRAGDVDVWFRIGESRRAVDLRASGHSASRCLTAALGLVRTEAAPDVGDVEVRVRFTYGKSS